jgi:thiamine biosynthesis lipoprotein ApbE
VDSTARILPPDIHYKINAGGDLKMSDWQSRTVDIRLPQQIVLVGIPMQNAALASSSDEQVCDTIDPISGLSSNVSKACFSVWSEHCMWADGLTKVLRLHPNPTPILQGLGATGHIFRPADGDQKAHATG